MVTISLLNLTSREGDLHVPWRHWEQEVLRNAAVKERNGEQSWANSADSKWAAFNVQGVTARLPGTLRKYN